jgi:dCTP deaminase
LPIPAQEIRRRVLGGELGMVDPDLIQPASIDLRLGGDFLRYPPDSEGVFLREKAPKMESVPTIMLRGKEFIYHGVKIEPGEFMLAQTMESICIPNDLAGQINGRSSVGRLGLIVHVTAGWIDPGFRGTVTLELVNLSPHWIFLTLEVPICTLILFPLTEETDQPYRGRYQNQWYTTPSRIHEGIDYEWRKDGDPGDRPDPVGGPGGRSQLLGSPDVLDPRG